MILFHITPECISIYVNVQTALQCLFSSLTCTYIPVRRRDRPQAWDSERLYPWGKTTGDRNMIDARAYYWDMDRCHKVKLNGLVGAPFYNQRFYDVHVSDNKLSLVFIDVLPGKMLIKNKSTGK